MEVKVKLLSPHSNNSLKEDKTYVVIAIEIFEEIKRYRIYSENESPNLYQAEKFQVVCHKIPPLWEVFFDPYGHSFDFTSKSWSEEGYWERYFDAEPEAIKIFTRDLRVIEEQSK